MMKFGTPAAVDGPGNASTKPGLVGVGVPSALRSGSLRPRRRSGVALSPGTSLFLPFLDLAGQRARLVGFGAFDEPPGCEGSWGAGVGSGAGVVSAGGGSSGAGVVDGFEGSGGSGVVGGGTIGPGSSMDAGAAPGGTSTGTISPLGSCTHTISCWAPQGW